MNNKIQDIKTKSVTEKANNSSAAVTGLAAPTGSAATIPAGDVVLICDLKIKGLDTGPVSLEANKMLYGEDWHHGSEDDVEQDKEGVVLVGAPGVTTASVAVVMVVVVWRTSCCWNIRDCNEKHSLFPQTQLLTNLSAMV